MPDIWTRYPDIVKSLLEEGGFRCGVEPRVLKGRDPNWTCVIDGEKVSGDLYIHPVEELTGKPVAMGMTETSEIAGFALLLALVLGLFVRRLRRFR